MELTLYTRHGCHLCDDMKAVINRLRQRRPVVLIEIDISTDIALERRYGQDIPVLLIDGTEVARHRIGEHDLRLMLAPRGKSAL